ncbi:hypothetical protein KC322_g29 [Hortaea werneckii]|nr:hypothetical protein KC322_g29 [Hortaea werneckii]
MISLFALFVTSSPGKKAKWACGQPGISYTSPGRACLHRRKWPGRSTRRRWVGAEFSRVSCEPFDPVPAIINRCWEFMLGRQTIGEVDHDGAEGSNHGAGVRRHLMLASADEPSTKEKHDKWTALRRRSGGLVNLHAARVAVTHGNVSLGLDERRLRRAKLGKGVGLEGLKTGLESRFIVPVNWWTWILLYELSTEM